MPGFISFLYILLGKIKLPVVHLWICIKDEDLKSIVGGIAWSQLFRLPDWFRTWWVQLNSNRTLTYILLEIFLWGFSALHLFLVHILLRLCLYLKTYLLNWEDLGNIPCRVVTSTNVTQGSRFPGILSKAFVNNAGVMFFLCN